MARKQPDMRQADMKSSEEAMCRGTEAVHVLPLGQAASRGRPEGMYGWYKESVTRMVICDQNSGQQDLDLGTKQQPT